MGRSKLPIKKIENTTNLQVTFSKRRYGLIKKAYEIAVLCDIDLTLIMLSPSGRLSHFSGRKRVEDVIYRYINLSERDRGGSVANREQIVNTLTKIKTEKEIAMQSAATPGSDTEEIQKEILELQRQLEAAEEQLRIFEPDSDKLTSLADFQKCEGLILEALRRIAQRKSVLLSKVGQQSSYQDTIQQINTVVQYITEAEAQGHGAETLLDQNDANANANAIHNLNFGSDAASSSATLRKHSSSPTLYESNGNENGQRVELEGGCENNINNDNININININDNININVNDDPFHPFHSTFTSLLPPDTSTSFIKDLMEGSTGSLGALDQQTMFLPTQSHQLPSSELHL